MERGAERILRRRCMGPQIRNCETAGEYKVKETDEGPRSDLSNFRCK